MAMLSRHLEPVLRESLAHFPVVLLTGARQVGKSTLARALCDASWPARYLTLDDRTVLDAARESPDGLVGAFSGPAVLDEVQQAPDLLRAIKAVVDRDRRPGRFLLTGSADILTLARVSETLAGRVAVHELHPFSWREVRELPPPHTLDRLFEARSARDALAALPPATPGGDREALRRFVLTGGFPTPALLRSDRARRTWFDGYRQTYVERDLRGLAAIEQLPGFSRLAALLLLRTGGLLNLAALSRDVGLPLTTLRRYFQLLVQTYQVFLVPPYHASAAGRLVKSPRVYAADTGLAAWQVAARRWEDVEAQQRVGPTLETWVAGELRKALSVGEAADVLCFWRTHAGREVDFVVVRGEAVIAFEVKAGAGIGRREREGLVVLRESAGRRWRLGVLLHGGDEAVALDDKTIAVPLHRFFA